MKRLKFVETALISAAWPNARNYVPSEDPGMVGLDVEHLNCKHIRRALFFGALGKPRSPFSPLPSPPASDSHGLEELELRREVEERELFFAFGTIPRLCPRHNYL